MNGRLKLWREWDDIHLKIERVNVESADRPNFDQRRLLSESAKVMAMGGAAADWPIGR